MHTSWKSPKKSHPFDIASVAGYKCFLRKIIINSENVNKYLADKQLKK